MGDEEAGETVADLPRFEADAEAIREADLRAAAAATSARGDPTGPGAPFLPTLSCVEQAGVTYQAQHLMSFSSLSSA